ncbi:hypothetical protein DSO57_1001941 [Entomophthora muscae]|uniref:Uncharacterized protein n=1 Tax=Entomophthora muscae TaxID=34485 RepID=A0ACC2UUG7_9FUNG|nr:hypothetical protein DSO57_1001941 [Entomophthora muscae]
MTTPSSQSLATIQDTFWGLVYRNPTVVLLLLSLTRFVGEEHRWGQHVLAVCPLHGWGSLFATWGGALGAKLAFTDQSKWETGAIRVNNVLKV